MRSMTIRRFALSCIIVAFSAVGLSPQKAEPPGELSTAQKQEVIQTAWQGINDLFYDPHFRGVDWNAVREPFLHRAAEMQSRGELENLAREMVALLHNSHSGVMSSDELARTRSILPFFFDKTSNRAFVNYVFEPRDQRVLPIRFGDEILAVDGRPALEMKSTSPRWLEPILTNAYYGPPNSIASLKIRRDESVLTVPLPRLQAFSDIVPMVLRHYGSIGYIRFLKMDKDSISLQMLHSALAELQLSRAIVLDFRHCAGGDASIADPLGAMLLGPHVKLVTRVPRPGAADASTEVEETSGSGNTFHGRVVVLIDAFTQSEPEMLTAALKDYKRVTIVGERSGGALNGFTQAVPLPYRVGILVVPVNRSISPAGNEYEGVGIAPDIAISNTPSDYAAGQDAPLRVALRAASDGH
jgi:tricorn protease